MHKYIFKLKELGGLKGVKAFLATLIIVLLQSIVTLYILKSDLSAQFLKHFFISHLEFAFVYGAILTFGFWVRGWVGISVTLTTTVAIFLLLLMAIWEHQISLTGTVIGGLLPWSDANDYYIDAAALLDGFPIGGSARRPLFVGLLATLLKITGSNLSICIVILVLINAIGTFFLAQQVSQIYGPFSGAIITFLSVSFYKHSGGIGTTLTENLGLALGVTSLAILYNAIARHSKPLTVVGIYFITLALCARAGTFFMLPAIIVACAIIFNTRQNIDLKVFLSGILASAAGFITNSVVGKNISQHTGEAFSNFSYTLYGLVVGGKGWAQVSTDYPLASEGSDIYKLAYQHFTSYPFDLLKGMLKMWYAYMLPNHYHAYQFIEPMNSNFITQHTHIFLHLSLAAGLICCFINQKNDHANLTLFAFVGYIASIPFVPPIDAGLRVYAATVGILFILPAVGIPFIIGLCHKQLDCYLSLPSYLNPVRQNATPIKTDLSKFQVSYAFILVILATIGPMVIKATATSPEINKITCGPSQEEVYFRYNPGNVIRIIRDTDQSNNPRVPLIRYDNIQSDIKSIQLKDDSGSFTENKSIIGSFNLINKTFLWITVPSHLLPHGKGIISACGKWSKDTTASRYGLFHIDEVKASNVD